MGERTTDDLIARLTRTKAGSRKFWLEYTRLAAVEAVCQCMHDTDTNVVGLRKGMGRERGGVSSFLCAETPPTIEWLSDALEAMGYKVVITAEPIDGKRSNLATETSSQANGGNA